MPQDYINTCSRDMLFIMEHLKGEVPELKKKLLSGEIDGSSYEDGSCVCLVGSLGRAACSLVPFYEKGIHNPGEQWFLQIREGDKPSDNGFSRHAVELCNRVLGLPLSDGLVEKKPEVISIDGKNYRKSDVEDRLKELETI